MCSNMNRNLKIGIIVGLVGVVALVGISYGLVHVLNGPKPEEMAKPANSIELINIDRNDDIPGKCFFKSNCPHSPFFLKSFGTLSRYHNDQNQLVLSCTTSANPICTHFESYTHK
jgi:hypothetical protein